MIVLNNEQNVQNCDAIIDKIDRHSYVYSCASGAFTGGTMRGFGNSLGDLAGQDIVLWREAGLEPMPKRAPLWGQLASAAAALGRSCRGSKRKPTALAADAEILPFRASHSDVTSNAEPPA